MEYTSHTDESRRAMFDAYIEAGKNAEAIEEANICLRLREGYAPAQNLINQLSVDPSIAVPRMHDR